MLRCRYFQLTAVVCDIIREFVLLAQVACSNWPNVLGNAGIQQTLIQGACSDDSQTKKEETGDASKACEPPTCCQECSPYMVCGFSEEQQSNQTCLQTPLKCNYATCTRYTEQCYINLQLSQPVFNVRELDTMWNRMTYQWPNNRPDGKITHFLHRTKFEMPRLESAGFSI